MYSIVSALVCMEVSSPSSSVRKHRGSKLGHQIESDTSKSTEKMFSTFLKVRSCNVLQPYFNPSAVLVITPKKKFKKIWVENEYSLINNFYVTSRKKWVNLHKSMIVWVKLFYFAF